MNINFYLLIESQAAINTVLFIGVSHLGYFTGPSVGSSSVICYKTLRIWDMMWRKYENFQQKSLDFVFHKYVF